MWSRDYRDILGGGVLSLLGVLTVIYSITELRLGSASRMGPGFFPIALGVLLAVLGLGIVVPAVLRAGEKVSVDIRSLLLVCVSVLAFAALVRPFGLIPAIVTLTIVASQADKKLSLKAIAILAVVLSLGATVIFRFGLDLQIPPFNWPW